MLVVGDLRNYYMKRIVFLLTIFTCLGWGLYAQPSPDEGGEERLRNAAELRDAKWYYDLDEALSEPEKVYKLSLADQNLKELPAEIGNLKNLQMLSLSNCKLKSVPEEIRHCTHLQMISLYNNKIKYLPIEFRELRNLEILYLGKNKLIEMPLWIGGLGKLKRLDISLNRISPQELIYIRRMLPKADVTY